MKMKKLIFIFLIFISWMSGKAQQGNDCYIILGNLSGKTELHPQMLFDTVCSLVDNFDSFMSKGNSSRWSNNFKIITNIPYPTKAFINEEGNFNAVFNDAVDKIETISPHYLGVIKEFYTSRINYRVVLKLPNTGPLEGLDEGVKEALRANIESAMNAYYLVYRNSPLAEIAGYSVLMKFIADLENGSLDYFGMMGFVDIPYNGETVTKTSETFTTLTNGKNFGGLRLDGVDIDNFLTFSDGEGTNFSYIISSKNDVSKINEMGNNFSNLSSKIKIWIHFDFIVAEDLPGVKGDQSGSRNGSVGIMKVKFDNNLTEVEADAILQSNYNKKTKLANCSFPNENFADNCIVPHGQNIFGSDPAGNFLTGLTAGFIGEIFNYIHFVYSSAQKIDSNLLLKLGFTAFKFTTLYQSLYLGATLAYAIRDSEAFRRKINQSLEVFVKSVDEITDIGVSIFNTLNTIDINKLKDICIQAKEAFMLWLNGIIENATLASASLFVGKLVGQVGFEIALAALGGAALKAAKMSTEFLGFYKLLNKKDGVKNWLVEKLRAAPSSQRNKCAILGKGCFIKDTPVLIASNPFRKTTAAYALAAMPIAVPIQDVQLLDYVVAHKSVNSTYGLTASTNEDIYIGLLNKDPYTSDQQRERDEYKINDTDWNEVTFEQVDGTSTCKLALNNDWISEHNYSVDAIVNMNLPEQGISGPFKITSIKHIIPQKKPVDEDENDEWEYRPVTGLFTHQSNDVWKITFDNGTALGVTNNHPIYSVSKGDWQHAGHLEIGEEVLALSGNVKVVSKERDLTIQPVYNLEVKDLHNFLVGDVGVVVHNNYIDNLFEVYRDIIGKTGLKHIFHGEIKNGKAYGCHHIRAVKDGKAKLLSNKIEIGPSGSGVYKAKVEVNGVAKIDNDGYSTFFPDNWDELKTMDKIKEAQNNVVKVVTENSGTKVIIGQTSEGIKIRITTYTQFNNNIYTAYPDYD